MSKKKYNFFSTGDLLLLKMEIDVFQRDSYGNRTQFQTLPRYSKVLYLGDKVSLPQTAVTRYDSWIHKDKFVIIKFFHLNTTWFCQLSKRDIFAIFRLLVKA